MQTHIVSFPVTTLPSLCWRGCRRCCLAPRPGATHSGASPAAAAAGARRESPTTPTLRTRPPAASLLASSRDPAGPPAIRRPSTSRRPSLGGTTRIPLRSQHDASLTRCSRLPGVTSRTLFVVKVVLTWTPCKWDGGGTPLPVPGPDCCSLVRLPFIAAHRHAKR